MDNAYDDLILKLNRIIDKNVKSFIDSQGIDTKAAFTLIKHTYMNAIANLILNNLQKDIPIIELENLLEDVLYEMVEDIRAGVIDNLRNNNETT